MTGTDVALTSSVGWDDDPLVAGVPPRPELTDSMTADACVIGLGASGLAAVDELSRRGLSVVGLDAGRVAAGAAGRNGGFLLGGTATAVHHFAERWGVDVAVALYRETLREIDRLQAALGSTVIRREGSIRLVGLPQSSNSCSSNPDSTPLGARGPSADDAAEQADCDAQFMFLRQHGIAVERYRGSLGSGLYLPDDAAMNPARRALGLAAVADCGARLFERSPVVSFAPGRVSTAHGRVSAGLIVIAVDGRLEELVPQLSGRVRTGRLQMLTTAPIPRRLLPCPVYSRWGYDYAQQDPSGRLFVGGGRDLFLESEWTADCEPTHDVQRWIGDLARGFAGGSVEVTHRWGASVGYTQDGRALVTEVEDGVVVCGGYSGTGNLVGPVAARAAVALGLEGTRPASYFSS